MKTHIRVPLSVVTLLLACCAAAEAPPVPQRLDNDEFQEVLAVSGDLYIAGQPSEAGLEWLKEQGVTTVVNLRTQPEMDNRSAVPYDEKAAVERLGMTYVHLPQGGPDTPYSPATVDAFARAIEISSGRTLLHCTVAWRASHLWTAYLMRYRDLTLHGAVELGRTVNLGTPPLEGFLGERLIYTQADENL
jgi:uncharacterized protein (TIGR01244 family)